MIYYSNKFMMFYFMPIALFCWYVFILVPDRTVQEAIQDLTENVIGGKVI